MLDKKKRIYIIAGMKIRHSFLIGFTIFVGSLGGGFRTEAASVIFQVVATFDYPGQPQGALFGTYPMGISDAGLTAGQVFMNDFSHHGFLRQANGTFSALINEPNDHANYYTVLTGVNHSSLMSGYYQKDDGFFTSFLLNNGVYSEFAIEGAVNTYIFSVNNAGDFCGWSGNNGITGFIDIAGTVTSFKVPDPTAQSTFADGINNLNQCVGSYKDVFNHTYGFLRNADGSFVYPFSVARATSTSLNGINDRGLMVGNYQDQAGVHAVLFMSNRRYAAYDYPGATETVFSGINKSGLICGYYSDSAGVHGLLLRRKAGAAN